MCSNIPACLPRIGWTSWLLSALNQLQLPILLHVEIQLLCKNNQTGGNWFSSAISPPELFKTFHTFIQNSELGVKPSKFAYRFSPKGLGLLSQFDLFIQNIFWFPL